MTPSSNSAQMSSTVHDDFALGKALDDLHTLSALLTATMKVAEPGSDAERCLKVANENLSKVVADLHERA